MTKKRNGEIDLLRFLFSIIIVFFHFNEFYDFGIFARGDIFVEFFFIVTGFLMAKSAEKLARSKEQFTQKEIADSTWKFTFNKVKTIFSYYISVVFIQLIVRYVIMRGSDLRTIVVGFFRSLPTFTLSFFGLIYVDDVSFYVGNTWFLSAMFIAILILFPLMLKAYDHSVKILFPLLGMFLLGYIYTRYGTIVIWANWMGYCYVGILRAVAEIAIGAFLYFLSCVIREKYGKLITTKNVPFKIILTLFKAGLFATVILFANGSDFGKNFTIHAFFILCLGVLMSFTEIGYVIPANKFTSFLGKISMPIFIFHGFVRWACKDTFPAPTVTGKMFILMIIGSIASSIVFMYFTDLCVKGIKALCAKIGKHI